MLIGLVAEIGSGKSTLESSLVKEEGFFPFAFADELKLMLMKAGICSYEELYEKKTPFSRMMMQKVGTDIFRNQVDKAYWIKKLAPKIEHYLGQRDPYSLLVTDVRFQNEADYLRHHHATLIRIKRPNVPLDLTLKTEFMSHDSEVELKDIVCDIVLENDSTEAAYLQKVRSIVEYLVRR